MDDLSRVMELGFFGGRARHQSHLARHARRSDRPNPHGEEFERRRGRQIRRFVVERIQTRSGPMPVKPATKAGLEIGTELVAHCVDRRIYLPEPARRRARLRRSGSTYSRHTVRELPVVPHAAGGRGR
jgi:hypothetical protein